MGDAEHFRSVLRHPMKTCPHVLTVCIDESLYFANTKYLEDYLLKVISDRPEVRHLVVMCSAVNSIDGSALETLRNLIVDLQTRGIKSYLSEVKGPVMDQLQKIGFVNELGNDHIFLTTDHAMRALNCL